MDPPPEMVAAVSFVSFHDFFRVVHGHRSLQPQRQPGLVRQPGPQESTTLLGQLVGGRGRSAGAQPRIRRVCRSPRGRNSSSARGPRGTATGPPEPTRRPLLAARATCPRRWTGCRSRYGSSPGGRTSSSARPSRSTGTCATVGSRCHSPSGRGPTRTCSPRAGRGCWARPSSGSTATSRPGRDRDRSSRLLPHRGRRVAYRAGLAPSRRSTARSTWRPGERSSEAARPRSGRRRRLHLRPERPDAHDRRAAACAGCRVPRGLGTRASVRHPGLRQRAADRAARRRRSSPGDPGAPQRPRRAPTSGSGSARSPRTADPTT